ncbi:hypothetical protein TX23_26660 [Pseudomonas paralactis]|uniref:Uncharacterized protein n=1 Tax=Pseudomonas paralactis TaxID=1615673 RepID=A0A0R2ZZH6_9PSED|nr:hypothetical protein [Pseudomonas paralactis]KRP65229.1 hypothetical protein TX23_26660 [Pseudomonas paralactis]
MDEQLFYEKIGQLLIDAGPSDAKKIIARAELFAEGDGGSYEFDYFNKAGDLNWFDPDGRAVGDLTELLVQLRSHFVMNGLCAGEKAWSGCVVTLDVENIKINIEFKYDN